MIFFFDSIDYQIPLFISKTDTNLGGLFICKFIPKLTVLDHRVAYTGKKYKYSREILTKISNGKNHT